MMTAAEGGDRLLVRKETMHRIRALGIVADIGTAGLDHPACIIHQARKARAPAFRRRLQHQAQHLLDEILEVAPLQLGLCSQFQIISRRVKTGRRSKDLPSHRTGFPLTASVHKPRTASRTTRVARQSSSL